MREQLEDAASISRQIQRTGKAQERATLVGRTDPLARLLKPVPGGSVQTCADMLTRTSQPRQLLLQLQRQYGNGYVQRVVALARQEDGEGQVEASVETAIERARGGGQPMDTSTRVQMESATGADFSAVRIHTDTQAHSHNEAANAVAFTAGKDIFLWQGTSDPGNRGGQELLAHELTHVVQQSRGPSSNSAPQAIQRKIIVAGLRPTRRPRSITST